MTADLSAAFDRFIHADVTLTIGVLLGAFILGKLLVKIIVAILTRIARRTEVEWDDALVDRLAGPVSLVLTLQVFRAAMPWLPLEVRVATVISDVIGILTVVGVLWGVFRAIDLARGILQSRSWAVARPATRSLLALGARFTKGAALVFGLLVALSQLGVSIASLLAGLGIGGIAIALAAQKTVENLFGTVSIGVDQPFREGDFVKVYDFVGTIEAIGLRSTRIRTLDRTLITVPNGELSNARVESFAVRDRIRLACTIGLVYETTAAQMRAVIEALEQLLRDHPKIWPDAVVVRFGKFNDSSLDIDVMAWFQTSDWGEFQLIRQDVLIAFMEAIERCGTSIAFPTRTLHVVQDGAAAPRAA